jgi:uncharacterized protein YeaO (DUF488 family)
MALIKIKRAYEPLERSDGFRILVDRLWPRGIKKEDAHFDVWLKEIAPTNELRKWFNHETEKWDEFAKKYMAELKVSPALEELLTLVDKYRIITLLYSAKDEEHNQAMVIKEYLEKT